MTLFIRNAILASEIVLLSSCQVVAATMLSGSSLNLLVQGDQRTALPTGSGPGGSSGSTVIHLKNGKSIQADAISEAGEKVEYTIGDSVYEIPKSLVQEITQQSVAQTNPSHAASPSNSNRITAPALKRVPTAFGDNPDNWYLYESTQQLRDECRSGQFAVRLHPEIESRSFFPNQREKQMECTALAVEMDSDYEKLVDRGVELQKILCTAGHGRISLVGSSDPAIKADEEEMSRITVEFNKRMTDSMHLQSPDRAKTMRMMIDFHRLAGTCGHGF